MEHIGGDIRSALGDPGSEPVRLLIAMITRMARFFDTIGASATTAEPVPPSQAELASFLKQVADFGRWIASPGGECGYRV